MNLYAFIYVMRPLTNSGHYVAVIKKENNFYECNSETRLIEDIMEYMRNCLIVMLFFINNETNKIFNVPKDFDFNELFDLGDFQPFKFNQNSPFLHLHPELQTGEFILNDDENNIDSQLPDIQSDETDSTFSQVNYKVTDVTDDYSNNEQLGELS